MKKNAKVVCVYDYGNYISFAIALSKHFERVLYHCVHSADFPKSKEAQIGKGIPEIEWVDDFDSIINETDIFCFPDCRDAGKQLDLESRGKQVFGGFDGVNIENDRWRANEILGEVGLPKVDMEKIIGVEKLKEYFEKNPDAYLKGNFRGDFETEFIGGLDLYEPDIDEITDSIADKENYEFIVCRPIDGDEVIEIGFDTFCIDGQMPESILYGIELKDKGYIGVVKKRSLISKYITEPLDKLAPILKDEGYRNFWSIEERIKGKTGYLTDFTMRLPEPPSSLYIDMILNLGDVVDNGSQGIFVEPIYSHKYGAHLVMMNGGSPKVERRIRFPKELKDCVKVKNLSIINGIYTYIPLDRVSMKEIGSVVAYGNTMQEAIKNVKEYAEQVEGNVHFHYDCLDKGLEEVKKCERIGIRF